MHLVKPVDMIALLHAIDEVLRVIIVAGPDAGPSVCSVARTGGSGEAGAPAWRFSTVNGGANTRAAQGAGLSRQE